MLGYYYFHISLPATPVSRSFRRLSAILRLSRLSLCLAASRLTFFFPHFFFLHHAARVKTQRVSFSNIRFFSKRHPHPPLLIPACPSPHSLLALLSILNSFRMFLPHSPFGVFSTLREFHGIPEDTCANVSLQRARPPPPNLGQAPLCSTTYEWM